MGEPTRSVTIFQPRIPRYRLALFDQLREALAARSVDLRLVYGQPIGAQVDRQDSVELEWVAPVRSRSVAVGDRHLVWQPALRAATHSDLVILTQTAGMVTNYGVLLSRWTRGNPKVAFWGHGRGFRAVSDRSPAELLKRRLATRVDWWFAYTERTARVVEEAGFDRTRVTVLNNTIDTAALRDDLAAVSSDELARVREEHGLAGHTGIFLGSMYEAKRLEFLIAACDKVAASLPTFRLLTVGGGPATEIIERAAESRPWLRPLGPRFGREKAALLAAADVLLMPGLVGLVIVDAFSAGLPLVTTDVGYHSPEIEYLRNGVNGLSLPESASPEAYAGAVVELLMSPERLRKLRAGSASAAREYTIESMVGRFADGIERALDKPSSRSPTGPLQRWRGNASVEVGR